jgi:hypothetical protein
MCLLVRYTKVYGYLKIHLVFVPLPPTNLLKLIVFPRHQQHILIFPSIADFMLMKGFIGVQGRWRNLQCFKMGVGNRKTNHVIIDLELSNPPPTSGEEEELKTEFSHQWPMI